MTGIGKFRDRVELQSPAAGRDGYGDVADTHTTVATVYARVEEQSGGELQQAEGVRGARSVEVEIRYYAGLDSTWRVKFGSRLLNVDGATNPDGRKRRHLLRCLEKV